MYIYIHPYRSKNFLRRYLPPKIMPQKLPKNLRLDPQDLVIVIITTTIQIILKILSLRF